MSPSDSSHSSWESPFDSSHSSWESTSDSDSDSRPISNSVLSSSRSSSEPTSLLSEGLTSVYHKVFPGSNFTRLLGGAASGLRRFDPLQRRPAESSISGRRGAWQVETQSQPEAAGQRVTQRAVVMAAPEPSLAARSPAAPPEQQEGAGDSADPELDSVSSAAPELPGTPAALDAPLQAEAAPRPGTSRPGPETFRQRFRQFRYQDAAGPREAFRQLRELSRQWLRPDIRTKEQIVEMLVQEQLQAILPEAARARRLRRRADVRITG